MIRGWIGMVLLVFAVASVHAGDPKKRIPMRTVGTNTWYVDSYIEGSGASPMLIDTGAGYSTINEETLAKLKSSGNAKFEKTIIGVLADGSRKLLSVYRITGITVGGTCHIGDITAAVFPAGSRQILGLSALNKVMPLELSVDPPSIAMSNCASNRVRDFAAGERHKKPRIRQATTNTRL